MTTDRARGVLRAGAVLGLIVMLAIALAAWAIASSSDGVDDDPSGLDPGGLAKLDPKSRELARFLDTGELVGGAFVTREPSDVLDLGRSMGLDPQGGDEPDQPQLGPGEQAQVYFLGPYQPIIRLAAHPAVMSATLAEDFRALRAIAPPRPVGGAMPVPGKPYVAVPLPVDLPSLEIPADRRALILASLSQVVETIDGRPYASVSIGSDCGDVAQVSCTIGIAGVAAGSVDQSDTWSAVATKAAGWSVALEPGQPHLAGVPRWLAREAERIARSDPVTAAEIGRYEEIRDFTWDGAAPGMIRIRYWRTCQFGSQPLMATLADHGVPCLDLLDVTIDVPAGGVVSRETSQQRT